MVKARLTNHLGVFHMPVSRKPLKYRPYLTVGTDAHARISKRTCWHFDAWVHLSDSGAIWLEIQQRIGGRVVRRHPMPHDVYRVLGDGVLQAAHFGDMYADAGRHVLITELEGKARAALLAVHRAYVVPWAARVPLGFTSRSVCLHYWPVPDVPAIPEGTMNYCVKGGAVAGPIQYDTPPALPDIFSGALGTVLA